MTTTARQRARLRANGADWYSIKNLADGTAEINIYDEVGYLGVTAQGFINELKTITADQISLRINSPGGEIFDGIAIMNAIRSHPAMVTTYVDGLAASIASVIAMAGDRVVMMPNSQMMIHDGSGLCVGNAADMRDMADLLDKQSDNIAAVYRDKAGGLAKTWRKRMQAETWYSAEEAVKAGLADEVAKQPARRGEQMTNRWDLTIYRYAGRDDAPTPVLTNQDQPPNQPEEPGDGTPGMAPMGPQDDFGGLVDTASPVHHTDTVDRPWDGGANERRLPSPMTVAVARRFYGWYDAEQVQDGMLPKQAGKLGHHEVDADGNPGPANLAGVRNALARLPQSDIPRAEWDAIRAHLNAHMEDGRQAEQAKVDRLSTVWSADAFHEAVSRATGMPPADLPDTFRSAVAAAASTASTVRSGSTQRAVADPGWREENITPPASEQESFVDFFRGHVARVADAAPAVPIKPAPEPEQDPYDPTVVIRALREANQQ